MLTTSLNIYTNLTSLVEMNSTEEWPNSYFIQYNVLNIALLLFIKEDEEVSTSRCLLIIGEEILLFFMKEIAINSLNNSSGNLSLSSSINKFNIKYFRNLKYTYYSLKNEYT